MQRDSFRASDAIKQRVKAALLADQHDADNSVVDRSLVLRELVTKEAPLLGSEAREELVVELHAEVHGLGALEPLLADASVSEVMVNGPRPVWVERRGRLECTGVELTSTEIHRLIERIVGPLGLRADRSAPIVDARLPDGSRVHAVLPPLAVDGPYLTIRRFSAASLPLSAFGPPPIVTLLSEAVEAKRNIVISGATSSGKTTLLNALAGVLPRHERVVTIEDAAELRLVGDHVVRLEARPGNTEGMGKVTIRDLVRAALRMRPDRLVIGEVRGGEALDMLQAMNTGHEGSMTTCHANSPGDALRRLEIMALMGDVELPIAAARAQIESLDLLVHVRRGNAGTRSVSEIAEVTGDRGETRAVTLWADSLLAATALEAEAA